MKKVSKTESEKEINDFFQEIKKKTPKEIKKIKKLAMSHNIPLREKRKLFCKHCLTPYLNKSIIRIKNKIKSITCDNCKKISRWKISSS
ncbi:MAG: adenylyl cyclase-associated domain-containing protein [Candidatus Pacearchaeota archaeon]|nr:adenylyl cyclase-associated domain-containing protein [Candidatus Pacearchaeota archaeon]